MCNCGGAIRSNRAAIEAQIKQAAAQNNAAPSSPAVGGNQNAAAPVQRRAGRGGYRLPKKLV